MKTVTFMKQNYELLLAVSIFTLIIVTHYPFYKAIILLLEFIVIIEVMKMISDFIEKKRVKLRYVIDVFIIFLTRDVVILVTYPNKDYFTILFLLGVIFIFFIFRIMAVQFSPTRLKYLQK
jgi:uncharacterized membrane protein (DUF373 family)